jgi:hypothetical protein
LTDNNHEPICQHQHQHSRSSSWTLSTVCIHPSKLFCPPPDTACTLLPREPDSNIASKPTNFCVWNDSPRSIALTLSLLTLLTLIIVSSADQTVSLSAFSYLFSEIVQYHQNRVDSISELERRLEATGYGVGLRVLELLAYRSREYKRETKLMNILQFVSTTVWKALFGKAADSLERSIDHADEFMIVDYTPLTR